MAEKRVPTTTKVTGMIQAHADLLGQHGVSAGVHASRPVAGTANRYYFSTDIGVWARDNGTTWDECEGLSEAYIQNLIDTSIGLHEAVSDAHHTRYADAEAASVAGGLITAHEGEPDVHHAAPTYDAGQDEVVFQIGA